MDDYLKLINHNNNILLFYENKVGETICEVYIDTDFHNEFKINTSVDSYGSLISIKGKSRGFYLKNSLFYNSDKHKSYKYDYINLDNDLTVVSKVSISLGEFYPMGMTVVNNRVYYFIHEKQLLYRDFNSKESVPVYTFEKPIIDIKYVDKYILVLLSDKLYLIDDQGNIIKGFKLYDGHEYMASSISESNNSFIGVKLKSDYQTIYKLFTLYGNQLNEIDVKGNFIGDSYIERLFSGELIIHSDGRNLYFNKY